MSLTWPVRIVKYKIKNFIRPELLKTTFKNPTLGEALIGAILTVLIGGVVGLY